MNKDMEVIKRPHGTSYRLPIVGGKRVITAEYVRTVTAGWDVKGFVQGVKEAKR